MTITAALNEDQLETLALFLEDQAEAAEGLDFFALHGLLTANAVSPSTLSTLDLLPMIFNGEPQWGSTSEKDNITSLINLLQKEIIELVESGQSFPVPCDLNVEADEDGEAAPLENWAIGFILLSIEQHEQWYGKHEENAAELLFPVVYASGLNADDDAFADIDDDEDLSLQVCASIPDNVIDLFLLYNGDDS
ncbi:MAG: YecA family protein [Bermanella sp.]